MIEFTLWYDSYNRWAKEDLSYVINANEVSEAVYLGDYTMTIKGVNVDKVDFDELMDKLNQYENSHPNFSRGDKSDMKVFFDSIGYKNVETRFTEGYGEVEKVLIYDFNDETFADQADLELRLVYEYCDGDILELSEDMKKNIIKVESKSVSLDEFDGSGWYTDYPFDYQEIFRIQEIDDVTVKDKYLLMYTTEHPNYIPTGRILNLVGVQQYVEKLGCDIDEYMKEIENLTIQS